MDLGRPPWRGRHSASFATRSGLALRLQESDGSVMTDTPKPPPPEPQDPEEARRKLFGRGMVILMLSLIAIYAYFTFRSQG
jgi:hypothetical protein